MLSLVMGHSSIIIGKGIVGINPDDWVVVSYGFIVLFLVKVDESSILMSNSNGRVKINGPAIVLDSLIIISHGPVSNSSVVVTQCIIFINVQSWCIVINSFIELF